jgi:hypothetical protein
MGKNRVRIFQAKKIPAGAGTEFSAMLREIQGN